MEQTSERNVGTGDCSYRLETLHGIYRHQSLVSLIEEEASNTSVVTRVELYRTYYESNQPTMPAARENVAAGGRAKECSPKTEDCSDGARPKDECDRRANGANSVTDERFAGSGSGSGSRTPKDGLKTRERYCLLFGVEKIPRPRERPGSRAVPPYAWTDLIIWDYVSPYIPGLTQVKALNAMEFLAFRGSRTNKEGIPQGEAMALADGLDGSEVLWVGKPVVLHCSPRTLAEGAADLAASRDYVRKRTHDRINEQRANAVRQAQRQRMEEMPRVRTPRGRGMGRRADRQAAEQTLRHHVAARERDQPLYAARDTPERDQVGRDRLDEWENSPPRGRRPPWADFLAGTDHADEEYTSAQEEQYSDGANDNDDDYSSEEDPDDPVGYDTETSRVETAGQRNRRRRRGHRRTVRNGLRCRINQGRGQRLPQAANAATRFLDLAVFKDSPSNDAISYDDWREQVQSYIRQGRPERQIFESVLASLEGMPRKATEEDESGTLEGVLYVLDKVYGGERSYVDLNNKMCNVAQSYNESVKDYFERVIAIRSRLIKHHSHMYREGQLKRQAKECFFDGLRPEYRSMISHLKDDPTKNMLDLLAGVQKCEEYEASNRRNRRNDYARAYPPSAARQNAPDGGNNRANGNGRQPYPGNARGNVPVKAALVEPEYEGSGGGEYDVGDLGEPMYDENANGEDQELELYTKFFAAQVQLADNNERRNGLCFNCKDKGHQWRACPQPLREEMKRYKEKLAQREHQLNRNGGPGTQGGRVPPVPHANPATPAGGAPPQ